MKKDTELITDVIIVIAINTIFVFGYKKFQSNIPELLVAIEGTLIVMLDIFTIEKLLIKFRK